MERDEEKERIRAIISALLGNGEVQYMPSKQTVESIIDQLIKEGKIPPREKWAELKEMEEE